MRRRELRGLATPQPTVTTRTAVYILLSGHCLERRAAGGGEGRCKKLWWSGGSQGGWRGQKIKQRALGVGGELGREGGLDDAVSCKKGAVVGRPVGHVRHSTLKRRRRRLLNTVRAIRRLLLVKATPCAFQIETSTTVTQNAMNNRPQNNTQIE